MIKIFRKTHSLLHNEIMDLKSKDDNTFSRLRNYFFLSSLKDRRESHRMWAVTETAKR